MNNQLRVFIVLLGAMFAALAYTFPTWQPYLALLPGGTGVVFTCLPPQYNEAFLTIANEQRVALVALADEDVNLACDLTLAHLRQDDVVPAPQQELPEMTGPEIVGIGNFVSANPALNSEGQVTFYQLADGRKILRINDLNITNVPDMQIWLSQNAAPLTREDLEQGGVHLLIGSVQGNVGSQNYDVAAEIDLNRYNSIVIFSESLELVVSYGTLNLF